MTDDMTTIDRAGPDSTDWSLVVREGNVEMRKTIPYDGVLVYSTEERTHVSHRKASRYNLSVADVLARYADETGRAVEHSQLPTTA